MRVGNFSLFVPEGSERDSGHVALPHGRQYTLRLGNHCYDRRCDAQVTVDGKNMGSYRINSGATIILERTSHDTGRFTFFRSDTAQAEQAGVASVAREERGLIRVTFRPEVKRPPAAVYTAGGPVGAMHPAGWTYDQGPTLRAFGASGQNASSGITGLTGQSDQQFVTVSNLDYDASGETTITLRLVTDAFVPRELTPTPRSNPVPTSVE